MSALSAVLDNRRSGSARAHARMAHAAMPGSRLEVFDGGGHFPFHDEPDRFVEVVEHFIDSTEPAVYDQDYLRDLGFPGQPPFTRGAHPSMYRSRLWTVRPLAGFGTPEDTNARFRYLLDQGATGLSLTFDYPTLRGYDSDQREARADAGKGGCPVEHVPALVARARDAGLLVEGLMTVGPTSGDPARTRDAFRTVAHLADELGLVERSMGMSGDLELAVEAGSTRVRLGTALFGARPARRG